MLSKETFNRPQCMWSLSPSRTSLVAARSALPKRRSTLETAVRWCCRTWVYWGPWRSSRELRSEREGLHRTLSVDAAHEACWRGNGSQQYDVQWSLYLYCSDRHTCIHRSITPVYNRCIRINHTCIQQVHIYQSHLYTTSTQVHLLYTGMISGHLPAHIKNAGGDRFWKLKNSNFKGLVTLSLDWVIQHTVVHHSSIST